MRRAPPSPKASAPAAAWRCCGHDTRSITWTVRRSASTAGIKIVRRALEEPLRQIVANAGQEPSVVLAARAWRVRATFGYNAATDDYGDLIAMGVIDPTKVTRLGLQNAASIASLILTTDCIIVEAPARAPHSIEEMPGGD